MSKDKEIFIEETLRKTVKRLGGEISQFVNIKEMR